MFRATYRVRDYKSNGEEYISEGAFNGATSFNLDSGVFIVTFEDEALFIPVANIVGEFTIERYEEDEV